MSAGPYTGDAARLLVATAMVLAIALLATALLDALIGPVPLARLP